MKGGIRTSRRAFLRTGGGAIAGLLSARRAPAVVRQRPPNLVFIHTDQQHFDTLSAWGCPHVRTPALDRLASMGASFDLSYSANPVCCPARAAWYTGRPSCENGVIMNDGWPLDPAMPDLGQWLSARGYDSVYAGKWHVTGRPFTKSFRVLTPDSGIGELTDGAISRAAEGFLRSRRTSDGPFFLNVGLLQPHDCCYWVFEHRGAEPADLMGRLPADLPPLPPNHASSPAEPALVRQRRRQQAGAAVWTETQWRWYLWNYYRMVEMADAEIGRILAAVEEAGLSDSTAIIWSVDHGEGLGRHGLTSKMFLYDDAARVPLIVAWPGHIGAARRDCRHLVSGLDIAPTLCDLGGVPPPPKARGRSLRPLLNGDANVEWREFVVAETHGVGRMVRTDRYKLIAYRGDPVEQLFDMQDDPGETVNLAGQPAKADIVRDLRARLAEWERGLEAVSAAAAARPTPPAV